ncbi:MAG TPA: hypothetical protein DCE56_05535 [Cyanobacteria bacterium UBA8553]|nr:hypothetical protein [Cyanobacteria bacterium UBA8553]
MCNTAEFAFNRLLRHAKIKSIKFDSLTLIKIAKQYEIGKRRLKLALPFLKKEYGYSIREANGKYVTKINWADVPSAVILDYVFGLDSIFNFRGYHIGVDVTANPNSVYDKQGKLEGMKVLWQAIGIDHTAVFLVNIPGRPPEMKTDALVSNLRKVIRGEQILEIAL